MSETPVTATAEEAGGNSGMGKDARKRLHALMYGLHYPAVLGTGFVVALLRITSGTIHAPAASVSLIVWLFFCLSFASAIGFEEKYNWGAFIVDCIELAGMFACLFALRLMDPALDAPPPSVRLAYGILMGVVVLQFAWRGAMHLQPNLFVDLKILFLALLGVGLWLGKCRPDLHWWIAGAFATLALLYVSHHPYENETDRRTSFFIYKGKQIIEWFRS